MIRGREARLARACGPQAWPAASGDGTQWSSSTLAGCFLWPARTVAGSGPLERAPSSGYKREGPRCIFERRGTLSNRTRGLCLVAWQWNVYHPASENTRVCCLDQIGSSGRT